MAERMTEHDGKLCMYFWIVQGAAQKKMRKGKAAGQVAHAAARLARYLTEEQWLKYLKYEVKVVYKVSSPDELMQMYNNDFDRLINKTLVFDSTWGKYTCMGIIHTIPLDPEGRYKLA